MKKVLLGFFAVIVFAAGCHSYPEARSVAAARKLILDGKAGCVIVKNGTIIHQENGRGISPILDILKQHPEKMKDAVVVDKVIGKAAAMVAICGKVRHVHAELICDKAVEMLEANNISVTCTLRVPIILNRRKDGMCPMDSAVWQTDDPAAGVKILEAEVAKMKREGK